MNRNIDLYANFADKEEYYKTKRLSTFSMVSVAGSLIINVLIIGYAVISALIA